MIIAIDYDKTYTANPMMFDWIIAAIKAFNGKIYIVTMRYDIDEERIPDDVIKRINVDGIIYTGRKGKRHFMEDCEIYVDIWIDDTPEFIVSDYYRFPRIKKKG